MFRGHDTPDEALVRACLESYRSRASTPDLLKTNDELQARYQDHTELVGQLVEYGHRLGLRCWIGKSEQKRVYQRSARCVAQLSDVEQRAYLPLISRGPLEALEQIDVIWYLRNKATFLIEVEWTAMLGEPLLKRGARIQDEPTLVRFLVVLPERVELVRFKLERSPLLRRALERDNWHILKADHLRCPGRPGGRRPRPPGAVPRPRPGDRAWRPAAPALRMSQRTRPERPMTTTRATVDDIATRFWEGFLERQPIYRLDARRPSLRRPPRRSGPGRRERDHSS